MRSDPHSHEADLGTLGKISIKMAKAAAKNTVIVAKSIRDLNNTIKISFCVRVCNSAIDDLNTVGETLKHMTKRDKDDMPIILSGVASDVGWCDNNFEMNPGDQMPAELKEASKITHSRPHPCCSHYCKHDVMCYQQVLFVTVCLQIMVTL
ncbi:pectinesterase inhibitor 2-like [Salvia divinorum]|uniref:Pectinesterase inhibitor 2-like n=1 Tax=Salvia divinorum TaxID=28513 RepID=A0ABD1G863_SALDI